MLPILERRAEIEDAIRRHQVVVICGETGSGKTTQLPQICLDLKQTSASGPWASSRGIIAHTQPRRLAARAVAARIAEEMNVQLGAEVGVKVRFLDRTSRQTRIKLLTDGMLLAELASDPELRAYSTIILDEAHERSLNIDFLLGYLRRLLPRRPDLKLVVTSATIDPRRFSDYFGGPEVAPVIEVSGRMYPVEVRYRPVGDDEEEFERIEVDAIADAVEELSSPRLPEGDILVFLPGEREIRLASDAVRRRMGSTPGSGVEVLPLYSRLSNQEQDRIFRRSPDGTRRVILATNVAETSLTVPGIRYVVDTGVARIGRYDPARKVQRLPIEPISRASANQRSGRCGRVAAGVCVRLFSEASFAARPLFTDPEIRRTNLASVILQMRALDLGAVEDFPFLDPPDAAAIKDGYETLFELGALDAPAKEGRITDIGRRMSAIPVDPRIARMLIGADAEGVANEVVVLAAVLSIQDPRDRPMSRQQDADRAHLVFRDETSDFLTLLKIWDQYLFQAAELGSGALTGWCREHFLSPARMREWGEMVRQLEDIREETARQRDEETKAQRDEAGKKPGTAHPGGSVSPSLPDRIHRALLTGLISNVACREGESGSFDYRGVRGNVVQIFPGSVLFKKAPKWIMAAEVVQTTRLYARTVARVDPAWIEELAGHMFRRQLSDKHLDPDTGEPSAWERVTMSGIVVVPRRRTAIETIDPPASRDIFLREGLAQAKWKTDAPFMTHLRRVLEEARSAEAKLRRRDVLADPDDLAAWFATRIPDPIHGPATFERWRADAERTDPRLLFLPPELAVSPSARAAFDPAHFPDGLSLSNDPNAPVVASLQYAFTPGKDQDGITARVSLEQLPLIDPARAEWLVPGTLPELVAGLLKTLPKSQRAPLDAALRKPDNAALDLAAQCAEVMNFGEGSLSTALAEAIGVLAGVELKPADFSVKALPAHLRLRFVVTEPSADATKPDTTKPNTDAPDPDQTGPKELAADRDLTALLKRFEVKIARARAARARDAMGREGITSWDFGELPAIESPAPPTDPDAEHPALIDRTTSVALTAVSSPREAEALTWRGVRRLFAIACRDEVGYHIEALAGFHEMARQYSQLGKPEELRDALTCLIAEKCFMSGQALVRTRDEFEERKESAWGRLSAASREVGDVVARTLEPRFLVAKRLSGGTPRLWADSIADVREAAAYLMPPGFFLLAGWDRVRSYPRYAGSMRARLLALREDGKSAETDKLATFLPRWKKFTGWVARAMSEEKARWAEEDSRQSETQTGKAPGGKGVRPKAPLPQTRRAAPRVNLDAGDWALQPGKLPPQVEKYRWAVEDLRVALFTPELGAGVTLAELDQLWKKAEAT
jgi:ATP-dependent helicase HrpA